MATSRSPSPPLPAPAEVADGVWAIPLPLPQSPMGSVYAYAAEHDDGILLVDAGYASDDCWTALEAGLAAAGRTPADITGMALTHNHPDHVGLAEQIQGVSGAWVAVHPLDALSPEQRRVGTFFEQIETELVLAGVPEETRAQMLVDTRRLATHSENLRADRYLEPGTLLAEGGLALRVLATPGHTRGHVCFHDEQRGILFGGDLLLRTGEIQLGVVATPDDDPAGQLLESLALVASLPPVLVLPGHGGVFEDAAERAQGATEALTGRISVAEAQVRAQPGITAWERCALLDWGRGWETMSGMSRRFAVMQMMGWLRRLTAAGRATLDPGPPERTGA